MVRHIAWFETLRSDDVGTVGGKNASLDEMVRALKSERVRVSDGFAITADAYKAHVTENDIGKSLRERLAAQKTGKASLHETGEAIRRLFLDAQFRKAMAEDICRVWRVLSDRNSRSRPCLT